MQLSGLLASLQWEDLVLLMWLGLIEPLLSRVFSNLLGSVQPWEIGSQQNPGLGVLFSIAALGGLVVVATRAPGQTESNTETGDGVAWYARLPMLVTLGYLLMYAYGSFSRDVPVTVICGLIAFYLVVSMLLNRLPVLPIPARRILVSPMIVLGTWNFTALVHTLFQGLTLQTFLNTPQLRNPNSSQGFVFGLLCAAFVFFYLVFIFAPRQIAYPTGSARDWLARFALYALGIALNLGLPTP